jgi:hypothetical protein
VFLSSPETWRLRACHTSFHERFWINLALYAALPSGPQGQLQPPGKGRLSAEQLRGLWADLASDQPTIAYSAIWSLAAELEDHAFLREQIRQLPPPGVYLRLPPLIADLDSGDFKVRQKAEDELAKLGRIAEAALHKHLQTRPPLEVVQRLERLLEQVQQLPPAPDEQRRVRRALVVLEANPSAEDRDLLESLAKGPPTFWLTQQAKAVLDRLSPR